MEKEGSLRRISRVEFVPANFASLIIALAWAYAKGMDGLGLVLPMFFALAVISLVSIAGAHFNTYSDMDLDRKDPTKGALVGAVASFGGGRIRRLMVVEVLASAAFMVALLFARPNPALVAIYAAAVFFAYAYSLPPFRFKARSLLAMCSLMLVLSITPITFTYLVVSPSVDPLFALFLTGQCLVIYGLIVPTEIRDHDWDKEVGIVTMTVWLGLGSATLLGITLLCTGLGLMLVAFATQFVSMGLAPLCLFLAVPAAAIAYVVRQYVSIRSLLVAGNGRPVMEGVVALASKNPKWITLVSQSIVLACLVLLVAKAVF